jgi:hypothetical protein
VNVYWKIYESYTVFFLSTLKQYLAKSGLSAPFTHRELPPNLDVETLEAMLNPAGNLAEMPHDQLFETVSQSRLAVIALDTVVALKQLQNRYPDDQELRSTTDDDLQRSTILYARDKDGLNINRLNIPALIQFSGELRKRVDADPGLVALWKDYVMKNCFDTLAPFDEYAQRIECQFERAE